jgi:hypothetical protein
MQGKSAFVNYVFLASAVLLLTLKWMGQVKTARCGNWAGSAAILLATLGNDHRRAFHRRRLRLFTGSLMAVGKLRVSFWRPGPSAIRSMSSTRAPATSRRASYATCRTTNVDATWTTRGHQLKHAAHLDGQVAPRRLQGSGSSADRDDESGVEQARLPRARQIDFI